ncbi:MAG: hypothetical protein WKG07_41785 [Hymenobacter sp.]
MGRGGGRQQQKQRADFSHGVAGRLSEIHPKDNPRRKLEAISKLSGLALGGLPAFSAGCPLVVRASRTNARVSDERTAGEKPAAGPSCPTPYSAPASSVFFMYAALWVMLW